MLLKARDMHLHLVALVPAGKGAHRRPLLSPWKRLGQLPGHVLLAFGAAKRQLFLVCQSRMLYSHTYCTVRLVAAHEETICLRLLAAASLPCLLAAFAGKVLLPE